MHSVTDGPTDGPTDGRTDKVTYRVACTRLKSVGAFIFQPHTTKSTKSSMVAIILDRDERLFFCSFWQNLGVLRGLRLTPLKPICKADLACTPKFPRAPRNGDLALSEDNDDHDADSSLSNLTICRCTFDQKSNISILGVKKNDLPPDFCL